MDWHEMSDAELLGHYAREGAQEAFEALVGRHVDLVYAAGRRLVEDGHLAEDVTQAVFLLLAQKAGSIGRGVVLAAWLHQTTRYVAANARRVRERRRHHEMKAQVDEEAGGAEEEAAWRELLPLLDEGISKLGKGEKAAVLMRYFEGRSVQEVAAALGTSANAATKRLTRGVERLRKFFAGRGIELAPEALGGILVKKAMEKAPAGVAKLAGLMGAGKGSAAATGMAKGATIMMAGAKAKATVAAALFGLLLVGGGVVLFNLPDQRPGPSYSSGAAPATQPIGEPASQAAVVSINDAADLPFPRARAPRRVFVTVPALECDDHLGGRNTSNAHVSYLRGDCWLEYRGFDFGDGADLFTISTAIPAPYAGKAIYARLDSPGGRVIATVESTPTGGWGSYACCSGPVEGVSGVHDLYLTFEDNPGNIAWFKFTRSGRDALGRIDGASHDEARWVTDGDGVSAIRPGGWCRYAGLEFGRGVRSVEVDATGAGRLEMRVNSLEGEMVAGGEISDGVVRWGLSRALAGRHDLYVVWVGKKGVVEVEGIRFSEGAAPATRAVTRPTGWMRWLGVGK